MKKLLSLSLVASATILSLNASAQDLSEAIKNVDVSGTVAYRYNDYETNSGNGQDSQNQFKTAVNIKSKVNDDITANFRIIAGSDTDSTAPQASDTGTASASAQELNLTEVNFSYTGIQNASVTVGKQAINTAFTMARDSIGNEHVGNGAVATYAMGPVSAYAAYFNQTNFDVSNESGFSFGGGENVVSYGLAATFGSVNLDASYVDVDEKFDAYTVGVDASYKVGEVGLASYARYSALDLDNSNTDNSLWKAGVKATFDIFGAYVAYGETDKEGGVVGMDASSTTGFDEHWRVTLSTIKDASVVYAAVDAQVTDEINVALKYSDLDADSTTDTQDEVYAQVVYQPSSNFFTYIRLGVLDREAYADDVTIGRLHMQYSF